MVKLSPAGVKDFARSPEGTKMIRYTMVSVVSVVVSQIVFFGAQVAFPSLSAVFDNLVACAVATVPSYYLNRNWAWGKSGKSHLWREVVPFWALAFLGLVFSLWAVSIADHAGRHLSHLAGALLNNAASLGAFGVLWIAKFFIFNKILFVHHPQDLPETLDGRTGVPT